MRPEDVKLGQSVYLHPGDPTAPTVCYADVHAEVVGFSRGRVIVRTPDGVNCTKSPPGTSQRGAPRTNTAAARRPRFRTAANHCHPPTTTGKYR